MYAKKAQLYCSYDFFGARFGAPAIIGSMQGNVVLREAGEGFEWLF